MHSFTNDQAYKQLKELAKQKVNLKDPSILTPNRINEMVSEACGFKLLCGIL